MHDKLLMLCAKFLQASYIGEKKILRDDPLVYLNIPLVLPMKTLENKKTTGFCQSLKYFFKLSRNGASTLRSQSQHLRQPLKDKFAK